MLFSYYFDVEKTHLLNCRFHVLNHIEKSQNAFDLQFTAEIEEIIKGELIRKETKTAVFNYPPGPIDDVHHVNFSRIHHRETAKWIFTVVNNKNTNQSVEVGLLSSTAKKNPIGFDVYEDSEDFTAELKENRLIKLPDDYVPPLVTQTVVDAKFEEEGYPIRFTSSTGVYDTPAQNYTLKEFKQDFREAIPVGLPFKIELDIAPLSVSPANGDRIFDVVVPNMGRVSLLKSGLEYLFDNGLPEDTEMLAFTGPVLVSDFYNNLAMTSKARMIIEGNGTGVLTVRYYDKTITSVYDHMKTFSRIDFSGAYAGQII